MKRLLLSLIILIFLLSACRKAEQNVTFVAVVESVSENSIFVTTADDVGFDRASVGFDKSCKIDFNPVVGQTVELEILPQIRESYPVQVTAVKVKLINEVVDVGYIKITGDKAAEMMQGDVIILDVRTQEEFDEGYIKDAILFPYDEIGAKAADVLPYKNATILVYCRTGRRSEIAARELIEMGYTMVYDFGGIDTDWNGDVVK